MYSGALTFRAESLDDTSGANLYVLALFVVFTLFYFVFVFVVAFIESAALCSIVLHAPRQPHAVR